MDNIQTVLPQSHVRHAIRSGLTPGYAAILREGKSVHIPQLEYDHIKIDQYPAQ